MAQALVAEFRVVITYTVVGKPHVQRSYCQVEDISDVVPNLIGRDSDLTEWTDCAQGWWDEMRGIVDNSAIGANAVLEQRTGAIWFPMKSVALTDNGAGSVETLASQYTLVVRDTAFKRIRVIIMEPGTGLYVGHSANGLGITELTDDVANAWNGENADLTMPYNWAKSRGDRYVLGSGAIAGGTYDLNDRMKRERGYE